MPGWGTRGIAYHGQYGRIYHNNDAAVEQTDTYTTGDIVGCYLCLGKIGDKEHTFVQFSKNGFVLNCIRCMNNAEYYPTIGSTSLGSVVEVNFGHKPFMCNIQGDWI